MPPTTDRLIAADGTPESVWRGYAALRAVPSLTLAEWLPRGARLVVVAPHPDDEVLACGALLAAHCQAGGDALVVGVSEGEASHGPGTPEARAALAAARYVERARGLLRLGATGIETVHCGLPDGGLAEHAGRLAARLEAALRGGGRGDNRSDNAESDVVVTTWQLDGHPDHEAVGRVCAEVCAGIGCRLLEAPVWMWHWAAPDDPRVPWHRLRGFTAPPEALHRKRRAIEAHTSQLSPRTTGDGPVLGAGILGRMQRDTEYFFV